MVDRIRYPTVSYLPFYYVFFQFLLLTIFNLQANILTTKDILSNLASERVPSSSQQVLALYYFFKPDNNLGCDKSIFLVRMRLFFLTSDTIDIL